MLFPGVKLKHLIRPKPRCRTSNKSFYISGEYGDIIYSLPSLKKIGNCDLYIGGNFDEFPNFKELDYNDVQDFKKILIQQDYINNVYYSKTCPSNCTNLNYFKNNFIEWHKEQLTDEQIDVVRTTNLTKLFSDLLSIYRDPYRDKWLTNNNKNISNTNHIIINRTFKYNNPLFPWKKIVESFGEYIYFVGYEEEYEKFVAENGFVKYKKTESVNDLFNVISSCSVFIGNQSFAYALAEGLKKNCIQETDNYISNCQFKRSNSIIYNEKEINFNTIKCFLIKRGYINKTNNSVTIIDKKKKKIFYIGQSGTSGYAKACKGYVYDFFLKGHKIDWLPLKFDKSTESKSHVDLVCKGLQVDKAQGSYDEVYFHCTPDLWPSYKNVYSETVKDTKVIGVSVWETEKLPDSWVEDINNNVDILQVPSEYNKQIYQNSGITVPIEIKPHIFHKEKLPDKNTFQITCINGKKLDNNKFTFYNISEFNERKGITDALKVFLKVFKGNNDVQFLIKTHYKDYSNENVNFIKEQLTDYIKEDNIFIITNKLSQDELLAFHSVGDCYLSLHKGEAFGLVLHEAFMYNKMLVTTKYGGQNEFLGDDYIGYVNYSLKPVYNMDNFNKWYHDDQLWAEPDLDHAEKILKQIKI